MEGTAILKAEGDYHTFRASGVLKKCLRPGRESGGGGDWRNRGGIIQYLGLGYILLLSFEPSRPREERWMIQLNLCRGDKSNRVHFF